MPKVARFGKLSEQLVLHLAREIVSGRRAPGDLLSSEPELALEFEVSKVVVREAVQTLAALGLLRVQQGKRSTVLPSPEWNILAPAVLEALRQEGRIMDLIKQLYEMRLLLETHAAREAATRIREEEAGVLRAITQRMRAAAVETADVRRFLDLDLQFHDAVISAAGNVLLRAVMRDLHGFLLTCWTDSRIDVEQLGALAEQHDDVARAICDHAPDRAAAAMRRHLEWAKQIEIESWGLVEPARAR